MELRKREPTGLALVAHDACKDEMVQWASRHGQTLDRYRLVSTGTTGKRIIEETGLQVDCLLSGPLGGDQQIGAMIAEGRIRALFFFIDSMSAMPHDVDVKALLRVSTYYQIALGVNERSATLLLQALEWEQETGEEK